MQGYAITLTTREGFDDSHHEIFRDWFKIHTDSCLLVAESHAAGGLHYHAGATMKQKSTNEVTRLINRFYEAQGWDVLAGISIKVKQLTDRIGWFHYLTKDLDGPPILVQGWKMTWIQEQCKSNLKKIPKKMLKKNAYLVTQSVGPELVIQYAKRTGSPLSGKISFANVICQMAKEGYQFHQVRWKNLYSHVMALCDDMRPMQSFIMSELQWLE